MGRFLIIRLNCFMNFSIMIYSIDPEYIWLCVVIIHERTRWVQGHINYSSILLIVEESKKLETETYLTGYSTLAFHYLSVIPAKDFRKHLNNVNYEPLLDLVLNPVVGKDPKLIDKIYFKNIICLPHIKVEFSYLDRLWNI